MAIRDIFKISRKTFFNPSGWIDVESLKFQNDTIWSILKSLFTRVKPERIESFEEAMKRLNLTEADVKKSISSYRWYAFIFLILGLLVFFYAFYLLFTFFTILGFVLALAASGVFLSQAFKYDFWAFQMKSRRLGITFEEWKSHLLGGKGNSA